jgi:hypothetical protein
MEAGFLMIDDGEFFEDVCGLALDKKERGESRLVWLPPFLILRYPPCSLRWDSSQKIE